MKLFYFALLAVLTLCSCGNNEKFVGIWESEEITGDGVTAKVVYTFMKDGTMTMNIDAATTVEEEGVEVNVECSVSGNGKWHTAIDMLTVELDENSMEVDITDMSSSDELTDALFSEVLDDPEMRNELIDQMKEEIDISDFSGSYDVESITANRMKIKNKIGETITYRRK
ncbi:MAG: hypothetical protein Q4D41_12305 [Prevotellaceae bacterium]|nr:hypothetical protein [Prevotellaceae bacterium]